MQLYVPSFTTPKPPPSETSLHPPEMLSQIKLKIKLLFDSTFKQMCRIMHSGIITEQIYVIIHSHAEALLFAHICLGGREKLKS